MFRAFDMEELMKRVILAVLCMAWVSAARPAFADEASHRGATEQLLNLMKVEDHMAQSIDKMVAMQARGNRQGASLSEVTKAFYSKYISWDALKDDIIQAYMDAYTESEVKELIAFHESPIGKKMTEKTPELSMKIMETTMSRIRAHMPELRTALSAAMTKEPAAAPPQTSAPPPAE
jgi:uncharacterized protein